MELKPRYKLTEVGVIPDDWKESFLGCVSTTGSGTTPARNLAERYFRNGSVHWVKTMDLNNSAICSTEEQVTKQALAETSLKVYPAGAVLIAMYGGFNQIGRTGLLRVPATVNQAITAVQTDENELVPEFLIANLNYRVGYWRSVASSSRKDPNITSRDIKRFSIAYPKLAEQRAIAGALSDVDALIGALDQLLAKKRDLKQAAMQQLLTGHQRLPGFAVPWEVKQLGDLMERIVNGAVYKAAYRTGVPITRIETIASASIDRSRVGLAVWNPGLEKYLMKRGDILFSHINSIDHIGKAALFDGTESLYHGMNLLLLRSNGLVSPEFLHYWLSSEPTRNTMRSLAKKAVSQASINTS